MFCVDAPDEFKAMDYESERDFAPQGGERRPNITVPGANPVDPGPLGHIWGGKCSLDEFIPGSGIASSMCAYRCDPETKSKILNLNILSIMTNECHVVACVLPWWVWAFFGVFISILVCFLGCCLLQCLRCGR